MTVENVSFEILIQTRVNLIKTLHEKLSDDDKNFILSVKAGNPKWELFAYPQAQKLPAIRWKIHNLSKISKEKRKLALIKLEKISYFKIFSSFFS